MGGSPLLRDYILSCAFEYCLPLWADFRPAHQPVVAPLTLTTDATLPARRAVCTADRQRCIPPSQPRAASTLLRLAAVPAFSHNLPAKPRRRRAALLPHRRHLTIRYPCLLFPCLPSPCLLYPCLLYSCLLHDYAMPCSMPPSSSLTIEDPIADRPTNAAATRQ